MLLNPTLYKHVQISRGDSNFTDPFYKIMEQQDQWLKNSQKNSYIKDLVYRTDLDHPHSLHNTLTQQDSMKVQFPATENQGLEPKMALNGFY